MYEFTSFFLNSESNVLTKRAHFFYNETLAIAIPHLISQVHLPSLVKILPKYIKIPHPLVVFVLTKFLLGMVVLKCSLRLFFHIHLHFIASPYFN